MGVVDFFKRVKPLFILFLVSFIAAISISFAKDFTGLKFPDLFMGFLLLFLSYFKIIDVTKFQSGFIKYDLLTQKIPIYGTIYPFLELILAILFFSGLYPIFTYIFTILIFLEGMISVFIALKNKLDLRCACLSTVFNIPLTYVTLVEDLFMLVMCLFMLKDVM
jgi:hypothetical protein